jgi:hypothetical protein
LRKVNVFQSFRGEGTWAKIPISRNRAREHRRIEAGLRIMARAAEDRNYVAGAYLDCPGSTAFPAPETAIASIPYNQPIGQAERNRLDKPVAFG